MPLIVTPGGSTSNSYVTIAEADALVADELVDDAAWLAADDALKTRALITAARLVDSSVNWYGDRYAGYSQVLMWPRRLYEYPYGYTGLYPGFADVQWAQAITAAWLLSQQAAGVVTGGTTDQALDSLRVGPITLDFASAATAPTIGTELPDHVWSRLRPYGTRVGGVVVPLIRT